MLLITGINGSIGKNLTGIDAGIRLEMSEDQMYDAISKRKSPKQILHLAAKTNLSVEKLGPNSNLNFELNVNGSRRLLSAFIKSGGKEFYFASTGHIYGPQPTIRGCEESDPVNPVSKYAEGKLKAEELLANMARDAGIKFQILRIFSVFGPGMARHYLAGRLEVLSVINKLEKINFVDDIRDFSTPIEVAKDIESVIANSNSLQILNICSGNATTVENQILQHYPQWPSNLFSKGTSNFPILVGRRNSALPPRSQRGFDETKN